MVMKPSAHSASMPHGLQCGLRVTTKGTWAGRGPSLHAVYTTLVATRPRVATALNLTGIVNLASELEGPR